MTTKLASLFIYEPAADSSVDPQYVYAKNSNITIQVSHYCRTGVYSVGEWFPDEQAMMHWGEFNSLQKAMMMAKAIGNGAGPAIAKANGWEL